ncbi:MAG: hypothetical protein ACN6OJ_09685 [Chryseobacterium sp.]
MDLQKIKEENPYLFRKENYYYNLPMDKLDKIFIDNGEVEEPEIRIINSV